MFYLLLSILFINFINILLKPIYSVLLTINSIILIFIYISHQLYIILYRSNPVMNKK
jgi:hypothetical protein